ncbi:hypothetical protein HHI36_024253 [Cryptolaemus montrouzieri]|uniref:PDEase domain-containing protein n=1 Tax=Cryptolaemus montrouzieri TaxID=559131 RepID=A0ABD2NYM2_9CUCU
MYFQKFLYLGSVKTFVSFIAFETVTHFLLNTPALKSVFSPIEITAALLAACILDIHHPGMTNQIVRNSSSELGLTYNNKSVLAVAFKLLQNDGCDIFYNLTEDQRKTVREIIVSIVLNSDMSNHRKLLASLESLVRKKNAGFWLTIEQLQLNHKERLHLLGVIVHCADLSYPTKPSILYNQWSKHYMEELFLQSDKERKSFQMNFIDNIVYPLWNTWADFVYPDAENILLNLYENRNSHASSKPSTPFTYFKNNPLKYRITLQVNALYLNCRISSWRGFYTIQEEDEDMPKESERCAFSKPLFV